MKIPLNTLFRFSLLFGLIGLSSCASVSDTQRLADGKRVAFERSKGNCLACHVIAHGEEPGNIGQPLVNMAGRFSDKAALSAVIWDATQINPDTSMPPFGRNKILTEAEIDQIVDYLWTL